VRSASEPRWFVYILKSPTLPKLYTGVTPDLPLRLKKHNGEVSGGAKFTRAGRPWDMAYYEGPMSQIEALRRERAIKKLDHKAKLKLCSLPS
jgi:putative endonuclease